MATHLLASHLTAKEVVGRFVLVAGLEAGEAETEAYVSAWKSGGGLLFGRNDPIVHTLVVSGFRTVDAELLCDKNVRLPTALKFHHLEAAPRFLVRAEKAAADVARTRWGERGGGAQLEVTLFALRGLPCDDGPVQIIARTLCATAEPFAKALKPALAEIAPELDWPSVTADASAGAWARAAARSPEFFAAADGLSVAAGLAWVRRKILDERIRNPEKAAPKNKVKIHGTARGGAVVFSELDRATGLPAIVRRVFDAKPKGTRLKVHVKVRRGKETTNVAKLDLVIDGLIERNTMYAAGWIPLAGGQGEIQQRM